MNEAIPAHRHTNEYYVMRFYPDVTTGEFLNIGIVVVSHINREVHIAVPKNIRSLLKVRWAGEDRISFVELEIRNFISMISDLTTNASVTNETATPINNTYVILERYGEAGIKYVNTYFKHKSCFLQLSEPLPCHARGSYVISMLYNALVNNVV